MGGYSRNPVQNSRISEAVEDGMELPYAPEMLLSDLRLTADINEIDTFMVGACVNCEWTIDLAGPPGAWVQWEWLENADPVMLFEDPDHMRLDAVNYIGLPKTPTNTKKWRHFLSVGLVNQTNIVDTNLAGITLCSDDRFTKWPLDTAFLSGDPAWRIRWMGGAVPPFQRLCMTRYFHVNQGFTYQMYGWMIFVESYQPPNAPNLTRFQELADTTTPMWPGPV